MEGVAETGPEEDGSLVRATQGGDFGVVREGFVPAVEEGPAFGLEVSEGGFLDQALFGVGVILQAGEAFDGRIFFFGVSLSF